MKFQTPPFWEKLENNKLSSVELALVKLGQTHLVCVEAFLVSMQLNAKKKKKKKKKKYRPWSDAVFCEFRS